MNNSLEDGIYIIENGRSLIIYYFKLAFSLIMLNNFLLGYGFYFNFFIVTVVVFLYSQLYSRLVQIFLSDTGYPPMSNISATLYSLVEAVKYSLAFFLLFYYVSNYILRFTNERQVKTLVPLSLFSNYTLPSLLLVVLSASVILSYIIYKLKINIEIFNSNNNILLDALFFLSNGKSLNKKADKFLKLNVFLVIYMFFMVISSYGVVILTLITKNEIYSTLALFIPLVFLTSISDLTFRVYNLIVKEELFEDVESEEIVVQANTNK